MHVEKIGALSIHPNTLIGVSVRDLSAEQKISSQMIVMIFYGK